MSSAVIAENLHEGITHRLSVIGVPTHIIKSFSFDVMKWVKCSGIEWTIQRLKSFKLDIIRSRAGLTLLSTFRKNRKGEFSGSLGSLFRFSKKNEECFGKALQASMIYSMFKFESLTQTQTKKFEKAINSPHINVDRKLLIDLGRSIKQNFRKLRIDRGKEISLLTYRGSPSKFKPKLMSTSYTLSGMNGISRKQDSDVLANAEYFLDPKHVPLYFEYQDLYDPVIKGLTGIKDNINNLKLWYGNASRKFVEGGEIHFLQEQGGKLRSIASPHLVHQLALKPLGDSIYSFVKSLPWDCTFNQSKPISILQSHLIQAKTIHSIDLSSATDYFPLEIQMTVLKALFGNCSDLRLFEDISRSSWRTQEFPDVLKWKRGQPLGLYPSFGTFTLSHGMLLWFLNGSKHENDFFVLGDDVVILNDKLHQRYINTLDMMDCPFSKDKSISSSNICEFAGKIITCNEVLPQYKWREMSNDNFLDICRQLGPRSRSLLTIRQKRVYDKVKHCCLPYGLNQSYPGSNLINMIELTKNTFPPNDSVVGSLTSLSSVIHQNVYGDKHFLNPEKLVSMDEVLKIIVTFDEKVRSVLLEILPQDFIARFLVFLKDLGGLSGVPEAVSNRDLPSLRLLPSRVTVLERMEKLLSI